VKRTIENSLENRWQISRRHFLKACGAVAASGIFYPSLSTAERSGRPGLLLRFGLVTDIHYADVEPRGTRYYRESLAKLRECVELMNSEKVAFLCELGDFKDQADPPAEESTLRFLRDVEDVFRDFEGVRYHVLGNHDMDSISKKQFLAVTEHCSSYYTFTTGGIHFIVLDACFTSDGEEYDHGRFHWTDANIPPAELEWLAADLARTPYPTITFVHQRLDGVGDPFVKNAEKVRTVLEESGKVLAVFQGHDHNGGYRMIGGIHYYTLKALVEGAGEQHNSYAAVEVHANGSITITGYRKAVSRELECCRPADAVPLR
jgi:predicted phosphodiesterase